LDGRYSLKKNSMHHMTTDNEIVDISCRKQYDNNNFSIKYQYSLRNNLVDAHCVKGLYLIAVNVVHTYV
jgi:hypothetical protein